MNQKRAPAWQLVMALGFAVAAVILAVGLLARRSSPAAANAEPSRPVVTVEKPVAAPAPPNHVERILAASDLSGAIAVARPIMNDSTNKMDPGTLLLGVWADRSMKLADVAVAKDETSYALVRKDSEDARGKRLCATGRIIEIAVDKGELGKFHNGLLMSYAGNLFHFLTVKSSGTLVEGNTARVCGVVTGMFHYSNSGGGTGHAVQLVGMFDIPENGGKRRQEAE